MQLSAPSEVTCTHVRPFLGLYANKNSKAGIHHSNGGRRLADCPVCLSSSVCLSLSLSLVPLNLCLSDCCLRVSLCPTFSVKNPHLTACLSKNCPRRNSDSQNDAATSIFSHRFGPLCIDFNADALGCASALIAAAGGLCWCCWSGLPLRSSGGPKRTRRGFTAAPDANQEACGSSTKITVCPSVSVCIPVCLCVWPSIILCSSAAATTATTVAAVAHTASASAGGAGSTAAASAAAAVAHETHSAAPPCVALEVPPKGRCFGRTSCFLLALESAGPLRRTCWTSRSSDLLHQREEMQAYLLLQLLPLLLALVVKMEKHQL